MSIISCMPRTPASKYTPSLPGGLAYPSQAVPESHLEQQPRGTLVLQGMLALDAGSHHLPLPTDLARLASSWGSQYASDPGIPSPPPVDMVQEAAESPQEGPNFNNGGGYVESSCGSTYHSTRYTSSNCISSCDHGASRWGRSSRCSSCCSCIHNTKQSWGSYCDCQINRYMMHLRFSLCRDFWLGVLSPHSQAMLHAIPLRMHYCFIQLGASDQQMPISFPAPTKPLSLLSPCLPLPPPPPRRTPIAQSPRMRSCEVHPPLFEMTSSGLLCSLVPFCFMPSIQTTFLSSLCHQCCKSVLLSRHSNVDSQHSTLCRAC